MSLEHDISAVITFGVFRLDVEKGDLKRLNAALHLAPQPFQLLVLLASRPGEVVTRDEIQEKLWDPHTFVDFERGLNHCVRQIRAVLGDDPGAPTYIETVPRIGYRFVAPVKVVSPARPAKPPPSEPLHALSQSVGITRNAGTWNRRRWIGLAATALVLACVGVLITFPRERKPLPEAPPLWQIVAVLPFENLTGDPAQEYLSDGVTDEMIVHLGRVNPSHLGVIARTSAMNYKHSVKPLPQIASELGVKYLLEGTVKRSGQTIRITAQLVRSDDQTELWADNYDGQVSAERILAFQQSVADRVARSLSLVLPEIRAPRSTTASQAAYEAFLKGRFEWNKRNEDGFLKSIEYFKEAIAQDPGYAEAWAGLADSYNLFREYYEGRSSDAQAASGRDAALQALTLDANLSEAHASLAFNLWRYEWKFPEAESEFHKALELGPNNATAHHWYGMFLTSRGRFDEAHNELRQAEELDPVSPIIITNIGWVSYFARDYGAAIQSYHQALKLDSGFQTAEMKLAWACEQKGLWQEALHARQSFYIAAGHPEIAQALANAYAQGGYPEVLRTIVAETEKPDAAPYYSDYDRAKLNAMAGDADKAMMLLERARARRSGWLVYLAVEPAFDKLRSNPAFAHLVDQTVSTHPL
jgi:TolB-like protein/DNA-binding winged helix-turn-helix (wHTH) protein/tetratricopeptide (TPR) repeat protein